MNSTLMTLKICYLGWIKEAHWLARFLRYGTQDLHSAPTNKVQCPGHPYDNSDPDIPQLDAVHRSL